MAARHRAPTAAWATAAGWGLGIVAAWALVLLADGPLEVARAIGLGFSAGLLVAAGLLLVAIRRDAGPSALSGVPRVALVSCLAALGVGWAGHVLLAGESAGASLVVPIVQVLVAGIVSVVVVGGSAALADPASVRTLLRVRSRSKGSAS
jgi:putative peptidoglycan lipid II flippase